MISNPKIEALTAAIYEVQEMTHLLNNEKLNNNV